MNCQVIIESTAWPCTTSSQWSEGDSLVVSPPVTFWDGSVVPLFVINQGDHVYLTDDGGVLQHLETSGFRITADTRKQIGLRRAIQQTGASFTTELSMLCHKDELRAGLQILLSALYAARHWEDQNAGRPADSRLLVAEAEDYLRLLRPNALIKHDIKLRGISGRAHNFPVAFDDDLFDAISAHPAASASLTKRLFDVRSLPDQRETPITIVIDDRNEVDSVKQDISLLSQLAHVERLTALRNRALKHSKTH